MGAPPCPLRVISGHFAVRSSCPLYPQSGHSRLTLECPLSANSGRRVSAKAKDQRAAHKGTIRKEALALQLGLIGLGGLAK